MAIIHQPVAKNSKPLASPALLRLGNALPRVGVYLRRPTDIHDSMRADVVTIAAAYGTPLRKSYKLESSGLWRKTSSPPNASLWTYGEAYVRDNLSMLELAEGLSSTPGLCLMKAQAHPTCNLWQPQPRRWHADYRKSQDGLTGPLVDTPSHFIPVDIDALPIPHDQTYDDPDRLMNWLVDDVLPEPFRGTSCVWQFSGSAGLVTSPPQNGDSLSLNVHLFFRSVEPISCRDYHFALKNPAFSMIDRSCGVGVQPIFTSSPVLVGGRDPIPRRVGLYRGRRDELSLAKWLEPHNVLTKNFREFHDRRDIAPRKPLFRPPFVMPYQAEWQRILYNSMGAKAGGYRNPIFKMISSAVRNGETDMEKVKSEIRRLVRARALELRDAHKSADIETYLADEALDSAFQSSNDYWFGGAYDD